MKKIVLLLLLVSFFGCQTSSHVYTILGHRYPKYLKCEDCTNKEDVKIASDRIMKNFLEKNLDNYEVLFDEKEDVIILLYQLKETFSLDKENKIILMESDGMIEISKPDCKILNIKLI